MLPDYSEAMMPPSPTYEQLLLEQAALQARLVEVEQALAAFRHAPQPEASANPPPLPAAAEGDLREQTRFAPLGPQRDSAERQQAEMVLRESEQRMRNLLDHVPIGMFQSTLEGQFRYVNPALATLLRYTSTEELLTTVNQTSIAAALYEDPTRRPQLVSEVVHTQGNWREYENRYRCKNGVIIDAILTFTERSDPITGQPALYGFVQDSTARKAIEARLQVALTKYRTLFDSFPLGITVSDATGQIVETNAMAERLLGLGGEEQRQRAIDGTEWRIVRSDGLPMSADEYASVRAFKEQRIVENVEMGIITSSGATTWLNVTAAPLPLAAYGVVITYNDITARRHSEERYRSLFEHMAEGYAYCQLIFENGAAQDWIYCEVNAAFETLTGLQHVRGKRVSEIIPGIRETDPALFAAYARVALTGKHEKFEMFVEALQQWFSLSVYCPAKDCFVAVFDVITERKRAESALHQTLEDLKRSNADLEQFAYVASHDLQEPLRAVTGMVQLLQQRYQGQLDARADQYIRHAVDAATRMQTLITDLLTFSRMQRRSHPLVPTPLEDVLHAALVNLRATIEEQRPVITHDALPTVQADTSQLIQLFQNLIGNAIKFRSAAPLRIHISTERREGAWCFAVHDNGIGIAPEYFERIFIIFQRLHSRQAYPGTGIGLALCKKIVERHGGQIWVESRLGNGATFFFTIPD